VGQTLALGVVCAWSLLMLYAPHTKILTLLAKALATSCVRLAGADGQVAPEGEHGAAGEELGAGEEKHAAGEGKYGAVEQKHGAGDLRMVAPEKKIDAPNKNIGAPTGIRIAPPKAFASLSQKHDASA
jgi:hypothetical protein